MSKVKITRIDQTKPVVNLDNLSFGDNTKISKLMTRLRHTQLIEEKIQRLKDSKRDIPDALFDEMLEETRPDTADALNRDICDILARVMVSIPSDWWVSDAPQERDLRDPEIYLYLKGTKVIAAIEAVTMAREPDEASGG